MADKRSNILYIAKQIGGINGAGQSAIDVLDALLANEYSVSVVTNRWISGKLQYKKDAANVRWYCPPIRNRGALPRGRNWFREAAKRLVGAYSGSRLERIAQRSELVLVNSLGSHDTAVQLKGSFKGRSVLIVRESPRHYGGAYQEKTLDWAIERMRQYDHYIFVSSNCGDDWARKGVLEDKKRFYIPNCCREDAVRRAADTDCDHLREQLGIKPSSFFVLCVGTIQHRKGQDMIVDQWPSLTSRIEEIEMCFAGAVPTDEGRVLCRKIQEDLQDDRLKLLGHRDDVMMLIRAADAVVLPSRSEAMPRVILEAMASKTAVVASDVDGNSELLEHQKSGLLFSIQEPVKMIDFLCQLACEPETRRTLTDAAYARYWKMFSKSHQIERYGQVISSLLEDSW